MFIMAEIWKVKNKLSNDINLKNYPQAKRQDEIINGGPTLGVLTLSLPIMAA